MPSLKAIRNRIASVKSTQKITRAMKMVAGARLNRAQQRILALRPYALKTQHLLAELAASQAELDTGQLDPALPPGSAAALATVELEQPLLVRRPRQSVLFVVITSDRG